MEAISGEPSAVGCSTVAIGGEGAAVCAVRGNCGGVSTIAVGRWEDSGSGGGGGGISCTSLKMRKEERGLEGTV